MTIVLKACTDPITDFTWPLFLIALGLPKEKQLAHLILTSLRTATVVALFFLTLPCNQGFCWLFAIDTAVSSSITFTLQFLIHPYAAALLNGFVLGGYPIVQRVIHAVSKGQMIFTQNDLGNFFLAIGFYFIALPLKDYSNALDRKYAEWSISLAHWLCKQPEIDDLD